MNLCSPLFTSSVMISSNETQPGAMRHTSTSLLPPTIYEKMAPSTTALSSPKSNPRDERPYTSQKSFSDVSRATATESVLVESTPPTSSSAVSSQEITQRPGHRSQAPEPETQPFSLELSQQTVFTPTTAHSPKSSPKRSTYQESLLAGHKRTANGETKWPESSEVAQAQPQNNEGATFHSRTSSTLSTGNMVEVNPHSPLCISAPY